MLLRCFLLSFIVLPLTLLAHSYKCPKAKCELTNQEVKDLIFDSYVSTGVNDALFVCMNCHDSTMGPPLKRDDGRKHLDFTQFPIKGHHGQNTFGVMCSIKAAVEGKTKNKMPKGDENYFLKFPASKKRVTDWVKNSLIQMNDYCDGKTKNN